MGKGDDPNCGAAIAAFSVTPQPEARVAWEIRDALTRAEERGDERAAAQLRGELVDAERRAGGRVFKIPADRAAELEKVVDRAGRSAMRTGGIPPTMRIADETVERFDLGGGVSVGRPMVYAVIAGGDAHAGDGWKFVGVLEHRLTAGERATVIRRLPGEETADLTRFAFAPALCEHCNTLRRRNETFLVAGPDGATRQVGRSCLADYIGSATPEKAARYAELILGVMADADSAERRASRWKPYRTVTAAPESTVSIEASGAAAPAVDADRADPEIVGVFDPKQYLAFAAANARRNGFITRRQEFDGAGTATATAARQEMFQALRGEAATLPDSADHEQAEQALSWVRDTLAETDPAKLSSFERNLVRVAGQEHVAVRDLPTLAAAIALFGRDRARSDRAGAPPASRHVGVVGQTYETTVTVIDKKHRVTGRGYAQTIYTLADADGNLLKWFSTASGELDAGGRYTLRGKVKRHDSFNGNDRTVLERCRLVS